MRIWTAVLLLPVVLLAGEGEAVQRRDDTPAGPSRDESGSTKKMKGSDDEVESLQRTVLRVGEAEVELTLDDVRAIRDALVGYLERSSYEDRDALLPWSRGPGWIDAEGRVRIGPWLLGSRGTQIFLRYREPPGALAGKAHKAVLARKDGRWTVTDMVMERIKRR